MMERHGGGPGRAATDEHRSGVRRLRVVCGVAMFAMLLPGGMTARAQEHRVDNEKIQVQIERRDNNGTRRFVSGYVKNQSDYRITNVRLRVDVVDANGQPLEPAFGWVYGDVRAGGEAPFRVVIPTQGTTVGVKVLSFHLVSRHQLAESP